MRHSEQSCRWRGEGGAGEHYLQGVICNRLRSPIDRLIINSPYEEPQRYWRYNRENRTFTLVEGERRPADYVIASESSKSFDDPGVFVEIPLVNQIRPRVKAWRDAGYPGVIGITKRLLEHRINP